MRSFYRKASVRRKQRQTLRRRLRRTVISLARSMLSACDEEISRARELLARARVNSRYVVMFY